MRQLSLHAGTYESTGERSDEFYYYKIDSASWLGNRNTLHQRNHKNSIVKFTNLDIIKPNGQTLHGQKIDLLEIVGVGTFADCYKAEYNGCIVAVKILKTTLHSSTLSQAFDRELHALHKTINSPHTIDLIGYRPQPHYWIITTFMNEGTLSARLRAAQGRPLGMREVMDFGIQISSAMKDLHDRQLFHRDLTPFNILFHDGVLCLADFGITVDLGNLHHVDAAAVLAPCSPIASRESYHYDDGGYMMTSSLQAAYDGQDDDDNDDDDQMMIVEPDEPCLKMGYTTDINYTAAYPLSRNGHPAYRAPEVNEGSAYSLSADVYSFGSVMYECMTGSLFADQSPPALPSLRKSDELMRRGNNFPDELWDLQRACWERDPKKRPSFDYLLKALICLRDSLRMTQS